MNALIKNILITGGGSGIGQSLAWKLANLGHMIFIVGRNEKKLADTQKKFPQQIQKIVADVANEEGRKKIVDTLQEKKLDILVNNAGIETPIAKFENLKLDEWRYTQATNTEGPLFLSQVLLPNLNKNARILFVSTGLAHMALPGFLAYCSSKAALYMIYQCLKIELEPKSIFVGSVIPGAVETSMQERLRKNEPLNLGTHMFEHLEKSGELLDREDVADFIRWILLNTSNKEFSDHEWNIEDDNDTRKW